MSEPILRLTDVGKLFRIYKVKKTLFRLTDSLARRLPLSESFWALKNISMEVRRGEKIALIGRNGAGKTTLFRLASGIYSPTEGSIEARTPVWPLFRYGTGMNYHMSVCDNIFLIGAFYGLSVEEVKNKMEEILAFSELENFLFLPVKNLSAGQVVRMSFSIFIQNRENFLAFDESAAMADIPFQKKMQAYFGSLMADESKTVLMASHSLDDLKKYCRTAIWLEKGRIIKTGPVNQIADDYKKFCANLEEPARVLETGTG